MSRIKIEDLNFAECEIDLSKVLGGDIKDGTNNTLFVGESYIGDVGKSSATIGAAQTLTVGSFQIISAGRDQL